MKKFSLSLLASSLLVSTSAFATAVPTDLSPWVAEGPGNWVVAADNNSVTQTRNKNPSVFHNNQDSQGTKLSGTIRVNTYSDDDYIGFVLGYKSEDLSNTDSNYILIDWKQYSQNYAGNFASKGLSISRVNGSIHPTSVDAWKHSNSVTELQRATTLGETGWADKTEYTFNITFTSTLIEVFINNNKELSVTGTFDNGAFGFYNYSQPNVSYSSITEEKLPEVPVPAAVWLFGSALVGLAFKKRR